MDVWSHWLLISGDVVAISLSSGPLPSCIHFFPAVDAFETHKLLHCVKLTAISQLKVIVLLITSFKVSFIFLTRTRKRSTRYLRGRSWLRLAEDKM